MDHQQTKQLTLGLIVVAIGLMLFARQLDLGWSFHVSRLWPGIFLVLAVGLTAWGALLWVDAGTAHMESAPSGAAHLVAAGTETRPGPDRRPAQVAWVGAGGLAVTAVVLGRRR